MAEVETDKATVSFEAVEAGFLAKILVPEGSKGVPLGQILAILVDNAGDVGKFKDFTLPTASSAPPAPPAGHAAPASASAPPATPVSATSSAPAAPSTPASVQGDRVVASPAARRLASERGINLGSIQGTGPSHRIVRADVEEAPRVAAQPTVAGDGYHDIPHSNVRKIIAQRLLQSKQTIPHYYLTADLNVDNILKLRKELNDRLEKRKKKTNFLSTIF